LKFQQFVKSVAKNGTFNRRNSMVTR